MTKNEVNQAIENNYSKLIGRKFNHNSPFQILTLTSVKAVEDIGSDYKMEFKFGVYFTTSLGTLGVACNQSYFDSNFTLA